MGRAWATPKVSCLIILLALCGLAPASQAQDKDVPGRYECAQAKVNGKLVSCKGAPLILRNNGKFELRGWEGDYLINGHWVELSDSTVTSRAKIEPGHKIVFRYHGKHGPVEMVYVRRLSEPGKTSIG